MSRFPNPGSSHNRFAAAKPLRSLLGALLLALAGEPCPAGTIAGQVSGPSDLSQVVAYLVAYLEVPPQASPAGAGEVHLDQKDRRFLPRVVVVPVGGTVVFHNSDDFLHNIHGRLGNQTIFNWGLPPDAPPLRRRFTEPGEVALSCDMHPEMEAWIKVVPSARFARADGDGRFRLEDVPPGEQLLAVWHPRATLRRVKIRVGAGGPEPAFGPT
jgi:plastocyanin